MREVGRVRQLRGRGEKEMKRFKICHQYLTDKVTWKCIFWGEERSQGLERLWEMGQSSMGKTQAKQIGNALCLRVGWGQERRQLLPNQLVVISFIFLGLKYRIKGWGEPSWGSWRSKNVTVGTQKKREAGKAASSSDQLTHLTAMCGLHRIEGSEWRHRQGFFGLMLLWFKKKKSLNYKHSCYLASGNSQLAGMSFRRNCQQPSPFSPFPWAGHLCKQQ